MGHFNNLTPEEAERLAMLAEECAEVIQVVGKILRHGYSSYHPLTPYVFNRELLRKEITDLAAVLSAMEADVLLPTPEESKKAWLRKLQYTHHQPIPDELSA